MIIKTKDPNISVKATIITRPSGDNPWYLFKIPEQEVDRLQLEEDIVENTSTFLSQFDLGQDEPIDA